MGLGVNQILQYPFLERIFSGNSTPWENRSDFEIILDGLKVYHDLTDCYSASLFSADPKTFEFYFSTSTTPAFENNLKLAFENFVENGLIAEVLNSAQMAEYTDGDDHTNYNKFILIPLFANNGIIGIIVLTFRNSSFVEQDLIDICRLYSGNFALILSNLHLSYELKQLKKNAEQKIALRTNNFVKTTRDLKKILDSIQAGILTVNKATGEITDANIVAVELIAATKDLVIGRNINDYFFIPGNSDNEKILKTWEALLKNNSGILKPVVLTKAEVKIGEKDFVIHSFLDITERKKMEDALLEARFELEQRVEERTEELLNTNIKLEQEIKEREKAETELLKLYWAVAQSPVGIIITDLDGVIEYANNKYVELSGFKYHEVIGSKPDIINPGNLSETEYKDLWETLHKERVWTGEFKNKKKDNDFFWVYTHITPIRNKNGNITNYLLVQEDITEKKQISNELVIAKEKAEESSRLKTALLSNMSHEFRTPLIGVLGFSQLLMTEIENPEQLEMLQDINISGKRLLSTLDGILNFSQLLSSEQTFKIVRVNISEFLRTFVKDNSGRGTKKNLDIQLELPDDQIYSLVNEDLLEQSFEKVFDNSIKYTNKGSVFIKALMSVERGKVLIKVRDTGIGIQERYIPVIFEAFRQSSEGHTRNFEGSGLGLTLAKKMLEVMNGEISVTSKPGEGSEFVISLPAVIN